MHEISVAGLGNGVIYVINSAILQVYFDKRRTLASSLAVGGRSLSNALTPLTTKLLVDIFAWRGAVMLLAGVAMQSVWLNMLLRPKATQIPAKQNDTKEQKNACTCPTLAKKLNLNLLCNVKFVIFGMGTMLFYMGYFMFYLHIVNRAVNCGLTHSQASLIPAVSGLVNLICRPLFGLLSTVVKLRNSVVVGVSTVILGIIVGVFGTMQSFYMMVVFSILSAVALCKKENSKIRTNSKHFIALYYIASKTILPSMIALAT